MGLVHAQGVQIPACDEKIKGVVNNRYIHNHAQKIAAGMQPQPEAEPKPEHEPELEIPQQEQPQPPGPFDFSSFSAWMTQQDQRAEQRDQRAKERAQRQEQRDHFLMDQQTAVFRSN